MKPLKDFVVGLLVIFGIIVGLVVAVVVPILCFIWGAILMGDDSTLIEGLCGFLLMAFALAWVGSGIAVLRNEE